MTDKEEIKNGKKRRTLTIFLSIALVAGFTLFSLADRYLFEHVQINNVQSSTSAQASSRAAGTSGAADADNTYTSDEWNYDSNSKTIAIKKVFKEQAYNTPVSSTKSMTGHLLGAAGGVEGVITALSIKNDVVPPTINYSEKDEECDLNYVPNSALKKEVNYAMSNSFGFGGHNAVIVMKKYK
jgi:3-oxoacyl-[acyl-carrier-protein] synthase II